MMSMVLLEPLGHHEVLVIKTEARMSGHQMDTVLANLQRKYGRDIVELGSEDASVFHNNQYKEYFDVKQDEFEDKNGQYIVRPLVYCSNLTSFLNHVAKNRDEKKRSKIGGDSGKRLFKLTITEFYKGGDYYTDLFPEAKKEKRTQANGILGQVVREKG